MKKQAKTKVPASGLKGAAKSVAQRKRASVATALKQAAVSVADKFEDFADSHLGPFMASEYKRGVNVTTVNQPPGLVVELKGVVPNALEHGWSAFDMKPGLLGGTAAKQMKGGGTYLDVPISKGPQLGGESVRVKVKDKEAGGSSVLDEMGYSSDAERKAITKLKGGRGGQVKFRRVSSKSSPGSWWHPGFRGIHAVQFLNRDIKREVDEVIKQHLKKAGKP